MTVTDAALMPDTAIDRDVDVIVIGAGFAGLYAIHLLREQGMTCHAYEAAQGVGGTWFWNRYPGARCDVESVDYCFSFSEELHRDWEWSERFATQPEILRYAEFVADRLDLRRDITFGAQVTSMTWDEETTTWAVGLGDGRQARSRFVISAVGLLSVSNRTSIPGLDDFGGRVFHTGHWPHEGVDFTGREVAVIGTGSSGIQLIPEIACTTKQLTVFQRTPNYALPARNRPLTAREKLRAKDDRLFIREQAERTPAGYYGGPPGGSIMAETPADVQAELERRWAIGGTEFLGAYLDVMVDREANTIVAEFVRSKIREIVKDPATAAKLEPHDHPIASKRPTVGTDYYETFNRENVELVDVRTEPILEITPRGVRTATQEYVVDDLVMATGYDAITGPLVRLNITGRGGRTLADYWSEGARSYLGLSTSGFPNLFTVTGPLSATALTNVMRSIEHHLEWIRDCLVHLRDNGLGVIEATSEAQDGWDEQVAAIGNFTFHHEVASWYTGGNIEGKARKLLMWVGGLDTYRQVCADVAGDDYRGFTTEPSADRSRATAAV